MGRIVTSAMSVCAVFLATACTQNPVDVTYKGKRIFGPDSVKVAAAAAPKFTYREQEYAYDYQEPAAVKSRELPPVKMSVARASGIRFVDSVEVKEKPPQTLPQSMIKTAELPAILPEEPKQNTSARGDWSQQAEGVAQFGKIELSRGTTANGGPGFIWPVRGDVVSDFGPKKGGERNDGINIVAPEGEPVFASADGMVVYAGNELPGYGNMIILRHNGGWMTAYAHASGLMVKKDEHVQQGDLIAYVGATGGVKTAQLHFGIRKGSKPVDPVEYLARDVAGLSN